MTPHGNLLAPPTRLPEDPATELLARGDEPAGVAAAYPGSCAAWAALAENALAGGRPSRRTRTRAPATTAGWTRCGARAGRARARSRGTHEPNQGFLRALHALGQAAAAIGEDDEAARCSAFLQGSDPQAAAALS